MRLGQGHSEETRKRISARMLAYHAKRQEIQRMARKALAREISSDLLKGIEPAKHADPKQVLLAADLNQGAAAVDEGDVKR